MTITGQTSSFLDSVLNAETTRTDIGVAYLKKSQDLEEQQGAALVEMLENSSVPPQRLDVYA